MNKNEIIAKVKELFGSEETVEMASIKAIMLQPVEFEIELEELEEGMEVSLEDGDYSMEDGTTFRVEDGKIADLKATETVVEEEGDEDEEAMNNEVEMSEEIVEEETNELDTLKAEMEAMQTELEGLKSEKVEMSAKIVELSNQPAEEEVKIEKVLFSRKEKDNDRLVAIRNAMRK
jgi:hypothetical protein